MVREAREASATTALLPSPAEAEAAEPDLDRPHDPRPPAFAALVDIHQRQLAPTRAAAR